MNKRIILILSLIILNILYTQSIFAVEKNFEKCVQENLNTQKVSIDKIKILNCSNKSITEFPNLSKFISLEKVDLSNNNIDKVSINLPIQNKINELDLSGNKLYYLDESINKLSKLKILSLTSCHLLVLPEITNLTRLNELNLENNQLIIVPNLQNNFINKLNIDNNYISAPSIKTKTKLFIIKKQKKLYLIKKQVVFDKKKDLLTPEEIIQRTIVSSSGVPLYGVDKYIIRESEDNNGSKVNFNDYLNISTGSIHKAGIINGYIDMKVANKIYQTNLKILFNIKSDKIIIKNITDDKKLKLISLKKQKNKTVIKPLINTNNLDMKKIYDKSIIDFLGFNKYYLLSVSLLLVSVIPFLIIMYIIRKIKLACDNIDELKKIN